MSWNVGSHENQMRSLCGAGPPLAVISCAKVQRVQRTARICINVRWELTHDTQLGRFPEGNTSYCKHRMFLSSCAPGKEVLRVKRYVAAASEHILEVKGNDLESSCLNG